jgi:hypothetical protein
MKHIFISFLFAVCFSHDPTQCADPEPTVSIVRLDRPSTNSSKTLLWKSSRAAYILDGRPVWDKKHGYLLFSDYPNNSIMKWEPGKGASLFLKPSGYYGSEPFTGHEPGSQRIDLRLSGGTCDEPARNRRIARKDADAKRRCWLIITRQAFQQAQMISHTNPTRFIFHRPCYGLPKQLDDPQKSGLPRCLPPHILMEKSRYSTKT